MFAVSDDGISIPCEYTSYLAPMQSSKLYNEVRTSRDKDKSPDVSICHLTEPIPTYRHFLTPLADVF